MLMKKLLTLLSISLLAAVSAARASSSDVPLVFFHVNVIDATGTPVQPDMTVVIQDGRVAEIGKAGQVRIRDQAEVIDGRGKYLIPGLWDMHVHTVFGEWLPRNEKVTLPLFVANGVI